MSWAVCRSAGQARKTDAKQAFTSQPEPDQMTSLLMDDQKEEISC